MQLSFKYPAQSISDKIKAKAYKVLELDPFSKQKIKSLPHLEKIGTQYGGWVVPTDLLDQNSVCYCAGVGEDISFDLGLIERFNCQVFAFDPTPRAVKHARKFGNGKLNYKFFDFGLWDKNEKLRFYAPANPNHVSHSVLNLQKTKTYFEADGKRLSSIMKMLGHAKLDLLKIDIEGAEYKVIESIIDDRLEIDIICVEYDEAYHPIDNDAISRIKSSLRKVKNYGYKMVSADAHCNYTFVRRV